MAYRRQIRKITGLKWARFCETPAWTVGARTRKGKIARGRAYERKLGCELERLSADEFGGDLFLGPWIEYEDSNGPGIAQPDAVIDFKSYAILLECKLKQSDLARQQIEYLYRPLLSHILRKRIICVEAFKYPTRGRNAASIKSLNLIERKSEDKLWSWHWIG